jgi:PKD repeat protein
MNQSLITSIMLSLMSIYSGALAIRSTIVTQAPYLEMQVHSEINADFTATPNTGTVLLSVQFAATPGDPALSYHWDFSDGTTATGQAISHTFTTPGAYFVRLMVSHGQSSETVGRHVIVKSPQVNGLHTVIPGTPVVGVDGLTYVTEEEYASGPSSLRIERVTLDDAIPTPNIRDHERIISPFYEIFTPDIAGVDNPDPDPDGFFYALGFPVPEGVDERRVSVYSYVPFQTVNCVDCPIRWHRLTEGFYHPASNMYYVFLSSYPALTPETFVLVEVDSEHYNNLVLETLPWELMSEQD